MPVTLIVSTTLKELESGRGHAVTAGGSLLPMSEVIRQAAAAHHYLAVFDNHTECPLYLGRSRRLASTAQRIVLHARDRGCTSDSLDFVQKKQISDLDHQRQLDKEAISVIFYMQALRFCLLLEEFHSTDISVRKRIID